MFCNARIRSLIVLQEVLVLLRKENCLARKRFGAYRQLSKFYVYFQAVSMSKLSNFQRG